MQNRRTQQRLSLKVQRTTWNAQRAVTQRRGTCSAPPEAGLDLGVAGSRTARVTPQHLPSTGRSLPTGAPHPERRRYNQFFPCMPYGVPCSQARGCQQRVHVLAHAHAHSEGSTANKPAHRETAPVPHLHVSTLTHGRQEERARSTKGVQQDHPPRTLPPGTVLFEPQVDPAAVNLQRSGGELGVGGTECPALRALRA